MYLFGVSQYPSCLLMYHSFRCPLFSARTVFIHSLEFIQFISSPVRFLLLYLFYFPLFLISFYSHHILLPLRTSFILAFSERGTISLYILKLMLHFPLISHTNCCIRTKSVNTSNRDVNAPASIFQLFLWQWTYISNTYYQTEKTEPSPGCFCMKSN